MIITVKTKSRLPETLRYLQRCPDYFKTQKVIVLAVGMEDSANVWTLFEDNLLNILTFLKTINSEAVFIVSSLLPLTTLADYNVLTSKTGKNSYLKKLCSKLVGVEYYDCLEKMHVGKSIPPEMIRGSRLSITGARAFARSLGHKISALNEVYKWN
jgi:hypothetical protein